MCFCHWNTGFFHQNNHMIFHLNDFGHLKKNVSSLLWLTQDMRLPLMACSVLGQYRDSCSINKSRWNYHEDLNIRAYSSTAMVLMSYQDPEIAGSSLKAFICWNMLQDKILQDGVNVVSVLIIFLFTFHLSYVTLMGYWWNFFGEISFWWKILWNILF